MLGRARVSMVSARVDSVPEYSYWGEVVSHAGVVLNVVEPSRQIQVLLLLLDGQVHLEKERPEVTHTVSGSSFNLQSRQSPDYSPSNISLASLIRLARSLVTWSDSDHLMLNVSKTNERVMKFDTSNKPPTLQ